MRIMSCSTKGCSARTGLAAGVVAFGLFVLATELVCGADWMFSPGLYSNDPKTGQRVDQYQQEAPAVRVPYDQYFSADGPDPYGMYDTQDGLYVRPPIEYEGIMMPAR